MSDEDLIVIKAVARGLLAYGLVLARWKELKWECEEKQGETPVQYAYRLADGFVERFEKDAGR